MDVVGAFFDLGGGGGVGKERLTGRGLLCGIVASFFCWVGFSFFSDAGFDVPMEGTRWLLSAIGLLTVL